MEASDTEEFEIKTEPIDFMEAPVSNTQNCDSDTYWSCLEFEDNGRCKRYISFERDISNQSEVGDTVQVSVSTHYGVKMVIICILKFSSKIQPLVEYNWKTSQRDTYLS